MSKNEILAGERLQDERFKEAAEENVTGVLSDVEEKKKKFENRMVLIMFVTTALACVIIHLIPAGTGLSTGEQVKRIITIILVGGLAFVSNTLAIIAVALKNGK